jgi:ATP-dependent RNA helicase DHX37/DHR1
MQHLLYRKAAALARYFLAHTVHVKSGSSYTMFSLQALERLRDRQDKDSRRTALLAELSANNSALQALQQQQQQQQQPGGCSPASNLAAMLTSSRTIGLGARVAATRAPDGSRVEARKRTSRAPTVSAITTALSGSSSESDSADSSSDAGDVSSGVQEGPVTVASSSNTLTNCVSAADEPAAALVAPASQTLQKSSLVSSEARQRCSSSSDEDENVTGAVAGGNRLTRGPVAPHPLPRSNEAREARLKLPIVAEEQPLMDLVHHNMCVVLQGETGCGKSTQVPQFLYESGYGHRDGTPGCVVVTQPRRVAAMTTARRIAHELGVELGGTVGYHVRHDRCASSKTIIKVVTDGILLREMQSDFMLTKYR